MCITFIYKAKEGDTSDYKLILATNRDENYERPTQDMAPWEEDNNVIGGRDLFASEKGTWLAVSTLYKKIGLLLNLPGGEKKANPKSRGRIVADYVKSKESAKEYIERIRENRNEYNDYILVSVELGSLNPTVHTYSNTNDKFLSWNDSYQGFSNSLPETPLKKVEFGKQYMEDICNKFCKIEMKKQLIGELVSLLKSEEKCLPDPELERRCPNMSHSLSSICINLPEKMYGSRTHTIILVTKSGHMDLIEITLQPPVILQNPVWKTTEFQFDL